MDFSSVHIHTILQSWHEGKIKLLYRAEWHFYREERQERKDLEVFLAHLAGLAVQMYRNKNQQKCQDLILIGFESRAG